MAYWLLKTEPDTWSWAMQKKKGAKGEAWSGVRNHQAKRNLMSMKKGERGFFYHSGETREIVGIVEVIGEYQPDPTDETGKFGLVVVKAVAELSKPFTLAEAKSDPKLAKMTLVTFSRLSVQPVTAEEWRHVCKLGGVRAL
jgi:predicted RNA-binding protein with PUA-like domain